MARDGRTGNLDSDNARDVQFRASKTVSPGKRTASEKLVQFAASESATAEAVHSVADRGVAGGGEALPFAAHIQTSFGRHDIGGVRAHLGGEAAQASKELGATAFTSGSDVAFAGTPDLRTTAHEAAHVVQQRGGVQLKGGVGESGDSYERHADSVADAVVAGRSAESLLDSIDGLAGYSSSSGSGVQRKAVQFWSGHEHRAMGNMAAIIATGDANFNVDDYLKKFKTEHGATDFQDPNLGGSGQQFKEGVKASPDPVLKELEKKGSKATGAQVRTNDTVLRDEHGMEIHRSQNNISFGAASEFGGDYSKTPEQLAKADSSDNPGGNDFLTMAGIAQTNVNHFYPLNVAEYQKHHGLALKAAAAGDRRQALLEEGFASHFLEDSFAAGHMAPRALDRTNLSSMDEKELGLNRTKDWHDALNAVTEAGGLPTNRGVGFHGDDTMTGNDLATIAKDVGASLKEVLTTLAKKPVPAQIVLPAPNYSGIMTHKDYGKIWRRMMNDYEQDLKDAEDVPMDDLKTDGGASMKAKTAAAKIRKDVFGGQKGQLLRLKNNEWNGDILVFNIDLNGSPAPVGTEVWVQWFDCDMGYDRHSSGREVGTLANDRTIGARDTDEKIGSPRKITLAEAGLGSAKAAADDTNDTYAVFYADANCDMFDKKKGTAPTVPIGRSKVQGKRTGKVKKPVEVDNFSWLGRKLFFRVTKDGQPVAKRKLYLRFYDQDSGFDRDSEGNMGQTTTDSDDKTGEQPVNVVNGMVTVTATGKANNPKDTYAVIYLDSAYQIPLGRSPVQPGSWYQ